MALRVWIALGSAAVIGACQPPCESTGWTSPGPEFYASGTVAVRGLSAAECSGGTSAPCVGDHSATCCTWSLGDGGCSAASVTDYRPTDGPLPTWVDLACGPVRLAFALPDLREEEPGTRDLVLPVVSWNPESRDLPGTSRSGGAAPAWTVGRELHLTLTVESRRGAAVSDRDRHPVTDDFRVEANVAGAIEAGADALSVDLALVQTAQDYEPLYNGCE